MDKNIMRIELPFFVGFYESSFSPYELLSVDLECDGLEYYKMEFGGELTADDLDVDFKPFKDIVGNVFVDMFEREMKDAYKGLVVRMDFNGVVSPREYNFESDRVFANVTFSEDWKETIQTFINGHKRWLEDIVAKEWTSRDGYVSYLPNTLGEWYDEFGKEVPDWRMVGTMLGYMLENELDDPMERLTDEVLERINISEFVIDTRRSVSVAWDTTSEDCLEDCGEDVDLPNIVKIPYYVDSEDIADWLSDTYGFCVLSYNFN